MEVLKVDGTTWELRCNTHGGETLRSSASPDLVYQVDLDGSTWTAWDGVQGSSPLRRCRRFQLIYNTVVARSAPDSDNFANVDHKLTFFPDGMQRMDRTTTFLKDVTLRSQFDWMSSHDITVPKVGRIGRGLTVIGEVDTFPKVAVPATPTAATATTGGTLAAATYTYAVTALSDGGETSASTPVAQATTGTTSTVTVTWAAVTSATGYRVYGRTAGRTVLLATLGPAATSWVDDGSVVVSGPLPPITNQARILSSTTTVAESVISGGAEWTVWHDPLARMCIANIYDRAGVAGRSEVGGVKTRLERGSGILKSYINAYWAGGATSRVITSGTTWTVTHFTYTYTPQDPVNYHLEAAMAAADISALKVLYPAT